MAVNKYVQLDLNKTAIKMQKTTLKNLYNNTSNHNINEKYKKCVCVYIL